MTDKEKKLIDKFLILNFGDLELETMKNEMKVLSKKNLKTRVLLHEKKNEQIFVNTKVVVDPILNMFKTDYQETYEHIKKWFCDKYDLDCIEIVGVELI
jgi:hypothetical protein